MYDDNCNVISSVQGGHQQEGRTISRQSPAQGKSMAPVKVESKQHHRSIGEKQGHSTLWRTQSWELSMHTEEGKSS